MPLTSGQSFFFNLTREDMGSNKKTQDRVQCETGQEWIAASGINAGFPGAIYR
jgi:hypothetical protein